MKTAIITISALLALSGSALAYERCSDRTGYCTSTGSKSDDSYGMTIFKPKLPNQPVDDRPGL